MPWIMAAGARRESRGQARRCTRIGHDWAREIGTAAKCPRQTARLWPSRRGLTRESRVEIRYLPGCAVVDLPSEDRNYVNVVVHETTRS
jgi:hypothetical protein